MSRLKPFEYSNFQVIETLHTISLSVVRAVLEKVFALVGTPEKLDYENISPLRCRDVQQYLRSMEVSALQRPLTKDERD